MPSGLEQAAIWERMVAQILAGDPLGQEALYLTFGRAVRFYFGHQLQSDEVEDKVHDTFVELVTAIRAAQLREAARLPGFVRTIMRRQMMAYLAQAARRRSESGDPAASPLRPRSAPDPERETMRGEQRQLARKILRALPEIDRQILKRFYFEGQPAERICRDLRLTDTQFRLRKSRAKGRLAELARQATRKKKPASEVLLRKTTAAGH